MAEGRVKFFHDKKGWGFIEREGAKDVFVHYVDIDGEGYRTLVKGERVTFDLVDSPKGHKAVHVARLGVSARPNGNQAEPPPL